MKINDLVLISISVCADGITEEGGIKRRFSASYHDTLRAGSEDAEYTSAILRSLAQAVFDDNAYGWLQQRKANDMIEAGELRQETKAELNARLAAHQTSV